MKTKFYLISENLKMNISTKLFLLSSLFKKRVAALGVVEVIMILLVVVGLVLIFKAQITTILNTLFKSIKTDIKSL